MNLLDYIQGRRKGKPAHRLEREAMRDRFLAEALEGYDAVDGNHVRRIASLRRKLSARTRRGDRTKMYTGIAAGLLIFLAAGSYFLVNYEFENFVVQSELPEKADVVEADEYADLSAPAAPMSAPAARVEKPLPPVARQPDAAVARKMNAAESAEVEDHISHEADENVNNRRTTSPTPYPAIGMEEYRKYLQEALVRRTTGECAGVKGIVRVEFNIDDTGKPYHFRVRKKLCDEADREAIRLIENGSTWIGDRRQTVTVDVLF
ncbi:MAG: hypothetical protein LBJ23_10820 [Tannerella sp.]|jgi:hypothetical protein|nr:hypothetical protein [Tannerella sp.]